MSIYEHEKSFSDYVDGQRAEGAAFESGKKEPSTEAERVLQNERCVCGHVAFMHGDSLGLCVSCDCRKFVSATSRGLSDAETLRVIGDLVGKACDEDVIMAVERVLAEHATKSEGGSEFPQSHD